MLIIVRMSDNKILKKLDAWILGCDEIARDMIKRNGYKIIKEQFQVLSGNMIWFVEK